MLGAGIHTQVSELHAPQRTARNDALDGLLNHALGETALEDRLRGAFLEAADEAGVMVIDLVVTLAPCEHRMRCVDDDDVVAAIDMRCIGWEVFAAKAHRDQGGEPADHQTFGVDQHPLLRHLGRLCRKRFHVRKSVKRETGRASAPNWAAFYTGPRRASI